MLRLSARTAGAALLLAAACQPERQPAASPSPTSAPAAAAPSAPRDTAAAPPAPQPHASLAAPTDSAFLLRRGYAGPLRLNMKEAALLATVPAASLRKTTRSLEGIEYPVYEFRPPGRAPRAAPLLLELVGDDEEGYRLWRVQLQDPRYRTAEGLGVGSTFGEVRGAYGIQTVERTEAGLVAVSERLNMSWVLDAAGLPTIPTLRKEDLPPATPVTGVILFR